MQVVWCVLGGGVGRCKIAMPLELRAKPPTLQVNSFFWTWHQRRPTMPQVDCLFWRDAASEEEIKHCQCH